MNQCKGTCQRTLVVLWTLSSMGRPRKDGSENVLVMRESLKYIYLKGTAATEIEARFQQSI
jgi:hypothetical protein